MHKVHIEYMFILQTVKKSLKERFENTKSNWKKYRQYNSQTKRDNNDLQNSAAKTNAWTNTNSIKILDFY